MDPWANGLRVEVSGGQCRLITRTRGTKTMKSTATSLMLLVVYLGSLAPSVAADQPNTGPVLNQSSQQQGPKTGQLEEVVVTGTHIRGVSPASPLIVLTSADIANSGLSTTGDVLRSLPQSFAGGQQSTIGTNGQGPWQNLSNFNNSE
jgi:hypothetical protein